MRQSRLPLRSDVASHSRGRHPHPMVVCGTELAVPDGMTLCEVSSGALIRLLLADDNETLRSLLGEQLREAGYEVVELRDGVELVDYVASRLRPDGTILDVDVIVSDIQMPGYTGMDVLVGLRRALANVPIILITGFGCEGTRNLAQSMGATAVLDKPFDVQDLTRTVAAALARAD